MTDKKPATFALLPRIINGGLAGAIGVTCVFPIDLVKTRLQNQAVGPNGEKMYSNMFDCFRKVFAQEGFFGMYRGAAVNIILVAPEKALKLACNDLFRFHLATEDGTLTGGRQLLAGGLAGGIPIIVTTPMELLKIQLQDAGRVARASGTADKKITALGITKQLLAEKGIAGLYKGAFACGIRDVIFSAIYFPLFAVINDSGPRRQDATGEAVAYWTLLAGLLSGMSSAFFVTPVDVIKTRLQAIGKATGDRRYSGLVDCVTTTFKHEGISAFFKGGFCRMAVIAPLYGIAQVFYYVGIGEKILGMEQKKTI